MKALIFFLFTSILLASCSQWSEKDSEKYMEQCEKSNYEKEVCNCHLEKIKIQFSSFEDMANNEEQLAEIWEKCFNQKIKDTKTGE